MYRVMLAALALALPSAGWTATINYYFAGSPYSIINRPAAERPHFTTGHLVIETDRLEGELAGATLQGTYDTGASPSDPAVVDFGFSNLREGLLWNYSIGFNQDREIERWEFTHDIIGDWVTIADSAHSSGYIPEPFVEGLVSEELQRLGYEPGTEAHDRLLAEWEWDYFYDWRSEGAGEWFTNPIAFASRVEENTRLALANPARSFNDVPPFLAPVPSGAGGGGPVPVPGGEPSPAPAPVPVPVPVALMLGALGLLGLAGRRGAAVRA